MVSLITYVPLLLFAVDLVYGDGNGTLYQANSEISANISFILSVANKEIATNSSHDTFANGIGRTDTASIYSNWPV